MRKEFAFIATIAIILSNMAFANESEPYANFTFFPEWPKVNENVTFNASLSYSVNGSIVNYTWYFGDGSIGYGMVVNHSYEKEGIYLVCLKVLDNNGINSTICKNVTVDSSPPSLKYEGASPNGKNGWHISRVKIEIDAKDSLSGIKEIRYRIDNGTWKNYSGAIYINNEGNHFIYFYAMDKSGNINDSAIALKIDYTAPATKFFVNKNATHGWYNEDVNVTLFAKDELSGVDETYYIIDGKLHEYDGEIKVGEGNHSFIYYSADKAGNIERMNEARIKVDKSPPVLKITSPLKGMYLFGRKLMDLQYTIIIGNVSIDAVATDALSGVAHVDFYIDGQLKFKDEEQPYSWEWNEKAIGVRDIKIVAYDNAGNKDSVEESVITINI
ncbi:MAG: PKD domain-containing protein [Thermoplasmata archaeon]|nr:MAG: PKD domain-containing protein [Thermoplasmata archaeon]